MGSVELAIAGKKERSRWMGRRDEGDLAHLKRETLLFVCVHDSVNG